MPSHFPGHLLVTHLSVARLPLAVLAVLAVLTVSLAALSLTGCDPNRGIYEGLRKQDELRSQQPAQPERTAPLPDYDTYKKEKPQG